MIFSYDIAENIRPILDPVPLSVCGDATLVCVNESVIFLAVFDGAGHGEEAYEISTIVIPYLKQNIHSDLKETIVNLHSILKGTRGGVLSICRIEKATGLMECTGIGNVVISLFNPEKNTVFIRGGILGYEIAAPKVQTERLHAENIIIIHSDGIKAHFDHNEIQGFSKKNSTELMNIILDKYAKRNDDASCIVMKVQDD